MRDMTKNEVLEHLGITYNFLLVLMKQYHVPRTKRDRITYYNGDAIEGIRKELEYRKSIRVSNWANGAT